MTVLMKGKVFHEHAHRLVYPVVAEVKYDEIRCCVKRTESGVEYLSYADKPLHNLGLWHDKFVALMDNFSLKHLDIGVLVNKNFNDSYRWTRSSKGAPLGISTSLVEFYVFDLPDHTGTYNQRRIARQAVVVSGVQDFGLPLRVPMASQCDNEEELHHFFNDVRASGHEGLMVKTMDHLYSQGKRIAGWLKMKPEDTGDAKITRIIQGTSILGVPLDRAGSYEAVLEDGSVVQPAGIPHELGRDMLANPDKYIGRWVEFKYMERDRAGGYRHPSHVRFREDKQ